MKASIAQPTGPLTTPVPVNDLIAASERTLADQVHALARARAFAEPLIAS